MDASKGSESQRVLAARDLCSFYIWDKKPALAVIFSRWDAEALASRSVATAALAVIGVNLVRWLCFCAQLRGGFYWFLLSAIIIAAYLSFGHYRQRALFSRFQMLVVLARETTSTSSESKPGFE